MNNVVKKKKKVTLNSMIPILKITSIYLVPYINRNNIERFTYIIYTHRKNM